jgi:hypothetical protein
MTHSSNRVGPRDVAQGDRRDYLVLAAVSSAPDQQGKSVKAKGNCCNLDVPFPVILVH